MVKAYEEQDSERIRELIASIADDMADVWDDSKVRAYVEQDGFGDFSAEICLEYKTLFHTFPYIRQEDLLEVLDEVKGLTVIPIEVERMRVQ